MADAPDNIADIRRHLGRALGLIEKKAPDYRKARDYYEGTRAEFSFSDAAEKIIEQAKATPISLAHIPVDVIANKVELASVTASEAAAKKILAQWWDVNDLDDESDDMILKACYFGDYYAIVDPQSFYEDDGLAAIEDLKTVGSSPLSTIVIYDAQTGRTPICGVKVWQAGTEQQPQTKAVMYYDDASVKLTAPIGNTNPKAADFDYDIAFDEFDEDAYVEHPGGRMLIAHLPIGGKPYGTPLHKKAWGPQDAISKISANNLVNVEAQGLPARWAIMDPEAEVDDDIDDDFGTNGITTLPDKDDGLKGATDKTKRVRAIPGAVAMLRGVKQVGSFDAATTDPFLAGMDWYIRVMAVACGVALFEFDMKGEQPSGESRRRAEGRSNRTAAKVKRAAGAFFRDLGDIVLGLLGTQGTVMATFNPSETATDKDGLELVAAKIDNGVPVRQALLEAGYTDEQVNEWFPPGTPAVTMKMLQILAQALAQLGNAKTLGVISDVELAEMLPEILTGARNEGGDPAAVEIVEDDMVVNPAEVVKAKAEAVGLLVRAGADPTEAAESVGLDGITFPNVPVTVRIPEQEAAGLEGTGAPAPAAPGA